MIAPSFSGFKQPFARERLSVGGTAVGLTASVYQNAGAGIDVRRRATGARVTVETNAIRFTEEGSTPVNTGGSEVGAAGAVGEAIYLDGYNAIALFKAIQSGASAGTIEVLYYR